MIAIIGAGGHGKVVAETAAIVYEGSEIVIFDDISPVKKKLSDRWSIVGRLEQLDDYRSKLKGVIVAIGENKIRLDITQSLIERGFEVISLVHPFSYVSPSAIVGSGSVILAGAVVNADAHIGCGVIINSAAVVEHDCVVEDGCHLSPNSSVAGACNVGMLSWIGMGALVKQGTNIGQLVTVGAGAVVISDVMDDLVVVGNPARPLNK